MFSCVQVARGQRAVARTTMPAPGVEELFRLDLLPAFRRSGELVIRGTGSEDFFNGGWYDVPGR